MRKILISASLLCFMTFAFAQVYDNTLKIGKIAHNGRIVIGASMPLKKEGGSLFNGMNAVFKRINKQGGIKKKKLVFKTLDDKKSIGRSVKNIRSLLKKTSVISNIFTTGVVSEFLESLRIGRFLAFAPEEGSMFLRNSDYKGIIHVKASIKDELEAIIEYAITNKKKFTFSIFYEDSTLGRDGRDIAKKIVEKYSSKNPNIKFLNSSLHPRGTVDIAKALNEMLVSKPEVIICMSRRHATYNFVSEAVNSGLFRTTFLGTSYLLSVQKLVEETQGVKFHTTSVLPNPNNSDFPIVKEYREAMNKYYPAEELSVISLSGYFSISILARLISKIIGPITHKSIIAEAEKLKNDDLGGLKLNFDANNRTVFRSIWISDSYKDKWLSVTTNFGVSNEL